MLVYPGHVYTPNARDRAQCLAINLFTSPREREHLPREIICEVIRPEIYNITWLSDCANVGKSTLCLSLRIFCLQVREIVMAVA